jgi:peptidoglycan/LPS O-acetylase OafA/YrhL
LLAVVVERSGSHYRHDIQGLRAFGIALVVVFHIWVGKVSGGVDVFFTISGFLMTCLLLRQLARTGGISPIEFWGRIILRILPSAYVVLLATLLIGGQIIPLSQWHAFSSNGIASALQLENIQLMRWSTDYLAREEPPGAFQQFWALSLQMQFYLLLPLLMIGVTELARRLRPAGAQHRVQAALFCLLAAASFAYALHATWERPAPAYYDPLARLWQFMIGAVCAVMIDRVALVESLRRAIGWIGLALILLCGIVIPVTWPFPGPAALVPVLGAAMVILSGAQPVRGGVQALLSVPPLQRIAAVSFTVYLWHWPLLIFAMEALDHTQLTVPEGGAVVALAIILAFATHWLVEQPLRRLSRPGAWAGRPAWLKTAMPYAIALAMLLPIASYLAIWKKHYGSIESRFIAAAVAAPVEPGKLDQVQRSAGEKILPQVIAAIRFLPEPYDTGCHQTVEDPEVKTCSFGSTSPDAKVIALAGGSHALQWLPAVQKIAHDEGIRVVSITKSDCSLGGIDGAHPSCAAWSEAVLAKLVSLRPDAVFTTATRPATGEAGDEVPPEYLAFWRELTRNGIAVVAIRDNPWMKFSIADCVARNMTDLDACAVARDAALSQPSPIEAVAGDDPRIDYVDVTDYLCTEAVCPAVANDMLIYRDRHHITVPYVLGLARVLKERIKQAAPEIFG